MLLKLVEDLGKIDSELSIKINIFNGIYSIDVITDDVGSLYSFSSTSIEEVYDKIRNFKECLLDIEKFDKLFNEVKEEALV